MKVCHAFIFFSIKFAGGTSDLMYKICKAQEKTNIKPVVYTGDYNFDNNLAGKLRGTDFRIFKSIWDSIGFSIMPKLSRMADKEVPSFDIVHMHVFRTYQNVILYKKCIKHNIPYVIDAHGAVPYYNKKVFIKKVFDFLWGRKMLRDAKFLIAETNVGVEEYLGIDPTIRKEKIKVLSPPFDTDEFLNLPERGKFREEFNIGSKEEVISFLGRVHYIKGNDFLIKAFSKLSARRNNVRLVIIGSDDGDMEYCKQLSNNLGVGDKVLFTGFLEGDKKLSALVDSDIVAQMSRSEQGAWAPMEAVLCKTPIVVTCNTGAGEDVLRLDAGYTVNFNEVDKLTDKLEWILDNYDMAKEKTTLAKAYIEKNLSMNSRIHEYTEIYNESIDKSLHTGN